MKYLESASDMCRKWGRVRLAKTKGLLVEWND